jgi:hypothetical protein
MMRTVFLVIFPMLGAVCAWAQAPNDAAGQALAQRLRAERPEENSRVTGTLIIRSPSGQKEIPIVCQVTVNGLHWDMTYQTTATPQAPGEKFEVIHSTNEPNQYLFARGDAPLASVKPADTGLPLAGSDFSLADLGLDFLHWPNQRQLKGEMRLGEPCYVLESSRPAGEIVRVKSYIDEQYGEPLIADAFDAAGHTVKEFSLHGSSFKKVNGQWHLQKMEIRTRKTHSQTELKFDIDQ